MVVHAPARIRAGTQSRHRVVLTACFLAVFLFAVQISSAAACLMDFEVPTGRASSDAPPQHHDGETECEAAPATLTLVKAGDFSPLAQVPFEKLVLGGTSNHLPQNARRGIRLTTDETPLFLSTGRLRI